MRAGRVFACALALWAGLTDAPARAAPAQASPARVVSMNLCTDQLAMLLAGPGQLHSVSHIALDPHVSAMADAARGYAINHGLAEEIYLMAPDLVLAGAYTDGASVAMLRRLGIPFVIFEPAESLGDVRAAIARMGGILHRDGAARTVLAEFDARLARLTAAVENRPRAVLYYANGYTSGDKTLAGHILRAAGFENAAAGKGYAMGRRLPLEVLAMLQPDTVITARRYPRSSRAEEVMTHPAVDALRAARTTLTDADWICGTPYVLRAIEDLSAARAALP